MTCMGKVGVTMVHLANTQHAAHVMSEMMRTTGQVHTPAAQHQMKLAAKEDLKMSDLLKYYRADSEAAKDLMSRRVKVRAWAQSHLFFLFISLGLPVLVLVWRTLAHLRTHALAHTLTNFRGTIEVMPSWTVQLGVTASSRTCAAPHNRTHQTRTLFSFFCVRPPTGHVDDEAYGCSARPGQAQEQEGARGPGCRHCRKRSVRVHHQDRQGRTQGLQETPHRRLPEGLDPVHTVPDSAVPGESGSHCVHLLPSLSSFSRLFGRSPLSLGFISTQSHCCFDQTTTARVACH